MASSAPTPCTARCLPLWPSLPSPRVHCFPPCPTLAALLPAALSGRMLVEGNLTQVGAELPRPQVDNGE